MSEEVWKPIPGYEGEYEASSWGRIRSLDRVDPAGRRRKGYILKATDNGGGYLQVTLPREKYFGAVGVHRAVCLAFHGEPPGPGYQVNHKNGLKYDNTPDNLEWVTRSENQRHSYRELGRVSSIKPGEGHPNAKLTAEQVREIRARWDSGVRYRGLSRDLARQYGISQQQIDYIVHRKSWKGAEYEPQPEQPLTFWAWMGTQEGREANPVLLQPGD